MFILCSVFKKVQFRLFVVNFWLCKANTFKVNKICSKKVIIWRQFINIFQLWIKNAKHLLKLVKNLSSTNRLCSKCFSLTPKLNSKLEVWLKSVAENSNVLFPKTSKNLDAWFFVSLMLSCNTADNYMREEKQKFYELKREFFFYIKGTQSVIRFYNKKETTKSILA